MKRRAILLPASAIALVVFAVLSPRASADSSFDFGGGGTGFVGTAFIFQGPITGDVFSATYYGVSYRPSGCTSSSCALPVSCQPESDIPESPYVSSVLCTAMDQAHNPVALESFPAIFTAKGQPETNELAKRVKDTQQDVQKAGTAGHLTEACREVTDLIKQITKESGKSLFADQATLLLSGPNDGHGVDVGALRWHSDLGVLAAAAGQKCP